MSSANQSIRSPDRPDARLVDPAAEVGRGADVRRHRDDASGHLRRLALEIDPEAPERLLGRRAAAMLAPERDGHGGRLAQLDRLPPQPRGGVRAQPRLRRAVLERRPRVVGRGLERARQLGELLVGEQRRVVRRVALGRQPPALERVGEHDARPVAHLVGRAEALDQRAEVVPAEVAERGQELGVLARQRADLEPPPQVPCVRPQQPLVLLVRHRVDPRAQLRQLPQPRAVLDHLHVPARRLEHGREPPGGDVRDHAVERLAVEVDHPHDLAELRHHRVGDRLPDRALVELGVADQRDLAAAHRHVEVPGHVAVGERAPDRRRRPDPHRAGRVVHRVRVLGPRRIRLQPAERAQRRQVLAVEPSQQVVDRVQHRRRVRLHAHAVGRLEDREPQRGHQRHHRRARRLVPADLHARPVRPHAVGVVDDRRRQPQHAPLHAVEDRQVELGRGGRYCDLRILTRAIRFARGVTDSSPATWRVGPAPSARRPGRASTPRCGAGTGSARRCGRRPCGRRR